MNGMSIEQAAAETAAQEKPEREVLGWLEFGDASRQLAHSIADSGFSPEIVVAIARGGLLLAGSVAYALGVKSCGSLNVEFYTGVDERLAQPEILPPLLDGASLAGKRVLLVDDVLTTGSTANTASRALLRGGAASVDVLAFARVVKEL